MTGGWTGGGGCRRSPLGLQPPFVLGELQTLDWADLSFCSNGHGLFMLAELYEVRKCNETSLVRDSVTRDSTHLSALFFFFPARNPPRVEQLIPAVGRTQRHRADLQRQSHINEAVLSGGSSEADRFHTSLL